MSNGGADVGINERPEPMPNDEVFTLIREALRRERELARAILDAHREWREANGIPPVEVHDDA